MRYSCAVCHVIAPGFALFSAQVAAFLGTAGMSNVIMQILGVNMVPVFVGLNRNLK